MKRGNIKRKKIKLRVVGGDGVTYKDWPVTFGIPFADGELKRGDPVRIVDEEGNAAIFYLHPTSIKELEAVADAGLSMPPKSTWFDPKLLTGLVFHLL